MEEAADSAFVVVNSFDYENEEIADIMSERQIHAEVFEIDRLQSVQRLEYLNCFKQMYNAQELPMVFLRDKFVGGFKGVQEHFAKQDEINRIKSN